MERTHGKRCAFLELYACVVHASKVKYESGR